MVDRDTHCDSASTARILVVDDNPTMRETIALIVDSEDDLSVCGEARCISEAVDQCATLRPDLVLVDLSLKGEDGLDLVRRLRESAPSVRSVVFSLHDEPRYIEGAREAGALGYVIKSASPKELLACLRSVRDGHSRFAHPREP